MNQSKRSKGEYDDAYLEALIDRALSNPDETPLPKKLAAKIIADGEQIVGRQVERDRFAIKVKQWWQHPFFAWGVAVACLVMTLGINFSDRYRSDFTDPGALASAVAEQGDRLELPWAGMGDARYQDTVGEVSWSDTLQQGVMRLRGLPVNDPSQAQYQLWIVDPDRDSNPVDGGVFDVVEGENLIAINAKLKVANPKAFAITLEQPGGVVVSNGPLLVIASG